MNLIRKFISCQKPPGFWWGVITVTLLLLPFGTNSYGLSLLTQALIFGILAMGLDILIGYTGQVSFNHATFFGVSAYTTGILFYGGCKNFWLALGSGIAVSVVLAIVLGLLVLRSGGPYFLMITLAFGQMIFALAWRWRSLTGGDDGLPGIARPESGLPAAMENNLYFYYLVLIFFLAVLLALWKFVHSPLGRSIVGIKESESRMQALGYNTFGLKLMAYALAAGVSGLAGVLYVYFTGFISPQELNWTMSGLIILMVIIGGAGTLLGPVIGAAVILVLQNLISSYTDRWPLFMGIIFVLCVMYARNGIFGYFLKLYKGGKNHEGNRS